MKTDHNTAVAACALALTLLAAACGGQPGPAETATPQALSVEPEDVAVAQRTQVSSGLAISGTLEAETEATLRAELAGTVANAGAEEGQRVSRGAVLARIEDPSLSQQQNSARSAVSSAEIAVQNARRDVERYQTLVDAGAAPRRDLENARSALASAQAQLASARSQQSDVQKTVGNATVTSPISGIVSAKLVNTGDVVQQGTDLYRVVDPSSMRLQASVPSEQVGSIKVGDRVEFTVRGYPGRTFAGRIERINPTADPATRQIRVHVSIPNPGGTLVAGLFADGRVTTAARQGLMVPAPAVETSGAKSTVVRLRGGRAEEVAVQVGLRDEANGQVEITSGLAAGDTVLVGPAKEIAAGTQVRLQTAARGAGAPANR
ncbi:MAG TPA: efflux RND transporter periplasmic adaptor subunit [Gemmatimonadales bacterium]|nr:efflux RND transporter periplasmic adaptor subunit [Gemmatimonadales bacterium]